MSRPLRVTIETDSGQRSVTRTGRRYVYAYASTTDTHRPNVLISAGLTLWRDGRVDVSIASIPDGLLAEVRLVPVPPPDGRPTLHLESCAIPFIDDRTDYPRAGLRKSQEEAP